MTDADPYPHLNVALAPICPSCKAVATWLDWYWLTHHDPTCTWMHDEDSEAYD